MPKTTGEHCQYYFDNYNAKHQHRDVWLKIRKKRYKEIRDNKFYLDQNADVFKKEVLQFWEGRKDVRGYNYQNSYLGTNKREWILFQDKNGETPRSKIIISIIKDFDLHGNYSWSNLQMGGDITKNMTKLKKTVNYLLDEKLDIVERFNNVVSPNGKHKIEGMNYGKATIFLHMAYPDKYGIWNGPVNGAFKKLGFETEGTDFGKRYQKINELLNRLRNKYSFKKYKNGFKNLSDVDIFVWYVADKFGKI